MVPGGRLLDIISTDCWPKGPDCLIMDESDSIKYSVVVCTHNHADRLKPTLYGLKDLASPDSSWELLIVNNASTDITQEVLDDEAWRPENVSTRIVFEPKLGIANARNRAVLEAKGGHIIFIDDDETPHTTWLKEYDKAIRKWDPDALGGTIEVLFEGESRPLWLQDELLGFLGRLSYGAESIKLVGHSTPIFTGNACFKKTVFDMVGLFDPELGRRGAENSGGEDVDLYRRMINAAADVRWVPDAIIYHRIQTAKLRKSYFLDLHYHQGQMEGRLKQEGKSRIPPLYLITQLGRALKTSITHRIRYGSNSSLRKEMNVVYFIGFISGWAGGK